MSPSSSKRGNVSRRNMLLIILAAYAWRIQDLSGQSLWRDEIDAIYFALRDLPATLSMFVASAQNGPLYFLSLRPWLRLMGTSEFALRFASVIFGVLSVPLLWQVARRLMPPNGSLPAGAIDARSPKSNRAWLNLSGQAIMESGPLLSALFLAANPYQLWYGRDGKMYALATFLALLASYFWLRAIGRGGWRPWLGFLTVVSLAIYVHLFLILLIPLSFTWFLLAWPRTKKRLGGYLLTLAGLTMPYLPMLLWQWKLLTAADQLTAIPFIPLGNLLRSVLIDQSHGVLSPDNLLWLAPVFTLLAYGLLVGFLGNDGRRGDALPHPVASRGHLLIVSWLALPVFLIYLLSLRQPVFIPRYVIWIGPALMMLMAGGAQFIWRHGRAAARLLAAALVIYVLTFWAYLGWQQKMTAFKTDLRGAITHIYERRDPNDLLILQTPYLEVAYRYYSSNQGPYPFRESDARLGWWHGGIWTNDGLDTDQARQQVDATMRDITNGATETWVLLSEAGTWDERNLMGEWLERNMLLVEEIQFHLTEVRFYRR